MLRMPEHKEEKEELPSAMEPGEALGKRERSPSEVKPPSLRELRAKRGRMMTRLEDAYNRVTTTAIKAVEEAKKHPPHKVLVQEDAPKVVQNLLTQFNENPGINAKALVSNMVIQQIDLTKTNVAINTIEKVQEGLQEAETETAEKIKQLEALPPAEAKQNFSDMELQAHFEMLDAKKRQEMLKWETENVPAATRDQLEAAIAKDNARTTKVVTDLDAFRKEKYGEFEKSGPLNISEDEETRFRAAHFDRLAKYEQEAITVAQQVVEEVSVEPVVAAQIVSERLEKVQQAAKRDRVKAPNLQKEAIGPETKKVVSRKATVNFKKALQFVQKVWWDVNPHYLNSRELGEIQKASAAQGLTIHTMVKNQADRVKRKMASALSGRGLKKYSLTTNSASNVEAAVTQAPFSALPVKSLNAIVNSYLGIVEDATPVEKATPKYKTAATLIPQIQQEIQNQEAQRAAPSRVARATGRRPQERQRVKVARADGLPKKPRKRSKPRKKRVKKVKESPKVVEKEKTKPATGLQKWHSHKKSAKKMRL